MVPNLFTLMQAARGRGGAAPLGGPKPYRPPGAPVGSMAGLAPTPTGPEYDALLGGSGGPLGQAPQGSRSLAPAMPPPAPPTPPTRIDGMFAPWEGDDDPGRPDPFGRLGSPPKMRGFDPAPQRNLRAEAGPMGKSALWAALAGLLLGGGRGALAAATGAGQGYLQGAEQGHRGRLESWQNDMRVRQAEDANAQNEWANQFRMASAQEAANARAEALRQRGEDQDADRELRALIAQNTDATRRYGINTVDDRQRDSMDAKKPLFDAQAGLMRSRAGYLPRSMKLQERKAGVAERQGDARIGIGEKNASTAAYRAQTDAKRLEWEKGKAKQKQSGVSSGTMTRLDQILASRPTARINPTYGTKDPPAEEAVASWYNRFEAFRRATEKEYRAKGLRLEMAPVTMDVQIVPVQPRDARTGQWRKPSRPASARPAPARPAPVATPAPRAMPAPRKVNVAPRKTSVRYNGFDYDVSMD